MLDIPAELERLASILETKAATARAKAAEHAKAREIAESERETKRATSGLHFAQVCKDAARKLALKVKRAGFLPPSWEELIDYCREKHAVWPPADIQSWFNHFESVGWKIGSGKQMVNWRRAADNGFAKWKEKNPERARPTHTTTGGYQAAGDPAGWKEFLDGIKQPYRAYRYAKDWIKEDYRKSRV